MPKSAVTAEVEDNGRTVVVGTRFKYFELTAQEAYDLHQALGAILSQCVQPFEPYPRE